MCHCLSQAVHAQPVAPYTACDKQWHTVFIRTLVVRNAGQRRPFPQTLPFPVAEPGARGDSPSVPCVTKMSGDEKILVTGATGFIGTRLVGALTARGRRVRALVRRGRPDPPPGLAQDGRGPLDHQLVELVAGDLPEVKVNGDRQFLNQMLTNLVENAIKYSSRSAHPQVHIETGRTPDSNGTGDWAWVSVQDNGPGIPAELVPKLYDRFYRVDEARGHENEGLDEPGKPWPSGSGLGLSIVQWIVKSHGGHIDVHSRPGEGATFVVQLPANRAGSNPA